MRGYFFGDIEACVIYFFSDGCDARARPKSTNHFGVFLFVHLAMCDFSFT